MGTPIKLHWSCFLILIIFFFIKWIISVYILGVFGLMLLHEFAHIFVMQKLGAKPSETILYPIGGLIHGSFEVEQEVPIALSGPLVNLSLIPILYGLSSITYFEVLFYLNIILFVISLIPAYPLDGGRIVRNFLLSYFELDKATSYSVILSNLIGVMIALLGLLIDQPIFLVFSLFLYYAADQESYQILPKKVEKDM